MHLKKVIRLSSEESFSCGFFMLSLAEAAQLLKTLIRVFDLLVYIEDYSSISTCIYIHLSK